MVTPKKIMAHWDYVVKSAGGREEHNYEQK
jgi:hypothetical protein